MRHPRFPFDLCLDGMHLAALTARRHRMDSKNYIELVRRMYAHPRLYGFFSDDEISEALSRYRSRIETILDRAEKESKTREGYLFSSMRFVAKSVHRHNYCSNLSENAYVYSHFSEDAVLEVPADAFFDRNKRKIQDSDPSGIGFSPQVFVRKLQPERRRLLYLVIKCAWDIDEELLGKCSYALGMPEQYLFNLIELVKRRTEASRFQIHQLNEKLNTLWIRMRVLELRLDTMIAKSDREEIRNCLERCRKRYRQLLEKRSHRKSPISNEFIADLLDVPKGSVDSGLYYLRKNTQSGKHLAEYQELG